MLGEQEAEVQQGTGTCSCSREVSLWLKPLMHAHTAHKQPYQTSADLCLRLPAEYEEHSTARGDNSHLPPDASISGAIVDQ